MSRKLFKFVVIGDSNVGKSALLQVYRGEDFNAEHLATIGVDFYSYQTLYKEQKISLQLWDTAGEERYRSVSTTYFRGAHAVFVTFSLNDRNSFDNLSKWLEEAKSAAPDALLILIGNKSDLEHIVNKEEALNFAESNGMAYLETSAKQNTGVNEAFEKMIAKLCSDDNQAKKEVVVQKVETAEEVPAKKGCC